MFSDLLERPRVSVSDFVDFLDRLPLRRCHRLISSVCVSHPSHALIVSIEWLRSQAPSERFCGAAADTLRDTRPLQTIISTHDFGTLSTLAIAWHTTPKPLRRNGLCLNY